VCEDAFASSSGEEIAEAIHDFELSRLQWHDLIGLKAREHFWADGFAMIRQEEFSPQCTVQHFRLTRWNAGIAQVTVFYNEGIALEGGERIPPFSEIHTFLLERVKSGWLISAEDIVQQNYREGSVHSSRPATLPMFGHSGYKMRHVAAGRSHGSSSRSCEACIDGA